MTVDVIFTIIIDILSLFIVIPQINRIFYTNPLIGERTRSLYFILVLFSLYTSFGKDNAIVGLVISLFIYGILLYNMIFFIHWQRAMNESESDDMDEIKKDLQALNKLKKEIVKMMANEKVDIRAVDKKFDEIMEEMKDEGNKGDK